MEQYGQKIEDKTADNSTVKKKASMFDCQLSPPVQLHNIFFGKPVCGQKNHHYHKTQVN